MPPLHVFETDVLEVTHLSLTTFGVVCFKDFWLLGCLHIDCVFETDVTHLSLTTFGVVFFEYSGVLACKDLPRFFETDVSKVTHFVSHDVITNVTESFELCDSGRHGKEPLLLLSQFPWLKTPLDP